MSRNAKLSDWHNLPSALALVYTAAMLMVLEYWYLPSAIQVRLIRENELSDQPFDISLDPEIIWSIASVVGYLVIPTLIVLFVHGEKLSSVGWRSKGFSKHVLLYLLLYVGMLPILLWVADRQDFLSTYPLARQALNDRSTFFRWEAVYLVQFIALEAFFRGYLLFTLEKRVGSLAPFIMTVPYAMIHFHKPPLEAFGAIIAGVVLGVLALRFRSWYGGAVLHILVATSMDFLAVRQTGLF